MHIKRSIKFLLHTRNKGDSQTGQNLAIRLRLSYSGKVIDFPTGLNIDATFWDAQAQHALPGFTSKGGQKSTDINRTIDEYRAFANDLFARYELLEKRIPTTGEVKDLFNDMAGRSKIVTESQEETFFNVFDLFIKTEGEQKGWSIRMHQKFATIKKYLQRFDGNLNFSTFTEDKLYSFMGYLLDVVSLRNTTAAKYISLTKWFLRWAYYKGYYNGKLHESFKTKLKGNDGNSKEVIHLTWDELIHLFTFNFPENQPSIPAIRDVFCFLCFTGLRHSDVYKLKRSDVKENHILVVTEKTADGVKIELNKYSRTILDKYKDIRFDNDKVLPVISNQKMNEHLKKMGKIAGINDQQRIVYVRKNKRIEDVYPKYALLTTHCGRRTFIVNSSYLGIPAEVIMKWTGHSDYSAMKPYVKIVDKLKEQEMSKFDDMYVKIFNE